MPDLSCPSLRAPASSAPSPLSLENTHTRCSRLPKHLASLSTVYGTRSWCFGSESSGVSQSHRTHLKTWAGSMSELGNAQIPSELKVSPTHSPWESSRTSSQPSLPPMLSSLRPVLTKLSKDRHLLCQECRQLHDVHGAGWSLYQHGLTRQDFRLHRLFRLPPDPRAQWLPDTRFLHRIHQREVWFQEGHSH